MTIIALPMEIPALRTDATSGAGDAAADPVSGAEDVVMEDFNDKGLTVLKVFEAASEITKDYNAIVSKRYGDYSILPYFNMRFSFLSFIASKPEAIK